MFGTQTRRVTRSRPVERKRIFDNQPPPSSEPFLLSAEDELEESQVTYLPVELTTGIVRHVPRFDTSTKNVVEFHGISVHKSQSWEDMGYLVIEPERGSGFSFPMSVLAAVCEEFDFEDDKKMLEFPPYLFYRMLEVNGIPIESARNINVCLKSYNARDSRTVNCVLHAHAIQAKLSGLVHSDDGCVMLINHFKMLERTLITNQKSVTTDDYHSFTTGLFIETNDPIQSVRVEMIFNKRPTEVREVDVQELSPSMYFAPLNEFETWDDNREDFTIHELCRASRVTYTFERADYDPVQGNDRVTAKIYTFGVNKMTFLDREALLSFSM